MSENTAKNSGEHESVLDKVIAYAEPLAPQMAAAWAGADDAQDYDRTTTLSRHTEEKVRGDRTYVDQDTTRDEDLTGVFDNKTMELIDGEIQSKVKAALTDREVRENTRANKRNFNRMMTLMGALVIGLVVTFVLTTPGIIPVSWHWLTPYTFVITILMDSGLAVYGYIRKY